MSLWLVGDGCGFAKCHQLGEFLGTEPSGGRLLGVGVLTDGVSCDSEFLDDGPRGQAI